MRKESIPKGFEPVEGLLVNGVFWHGQSTLREEDVLRRVWQRTYAPYLTKGFVVLALISVSAFFLALSLAEIQTLSLRRPEALFLWLGCLFGMTAISYHFRSKHHSAPLPQSAKLTAEPSVLPDLNIVERHQPISATFSADALRILDDAYLSAKKSHHAKLVPLHAFVSLLHDSSMHALFIRLGLSLDQFEGPIARQLSLIDNGELEHSTECQTVYVHAFKHALQNHKQSVGAIDLFAALYETQPFLQELFYALGVNEEQMANVISWLETEETLVKRYKSFRQSAMFKPTGAMNRAYTSVQTKFLDSVAYDLTAQAVRGGLPLLIGREEETEEILRLIEGGRQSVVLVGEHGVGKDAIIYGIAERMVEERVPNSLKDKRLMELSIPHIIGAEGGAKAQERLLLALQEVARSKNIILVIPNIDQLTTAHIGGLDLGSILAQELERGYTFVIATSTPERHKQEIEGTILGARFAPVRVEEPKANDAIRILESMVGGLENKFKVIFTYDAISALVELSDRYMHESFLPEKAVHLAEEVAMLVQNKGIEWERILGSDVESLVSQKTKVNVTRVNQAEGEELLNLEEKMHERMIGQYEAVKAVASALRRSRTQLRAQNRPIGNFLFLGPTGVGKTELAKTTAEVYFGSEQSMVRFDMSEYQDQASISRLIGGANETGLLTEAIRRNPFTVLLLDEIEKAHPDILNLFLQVMDDGRLTDGTGRTIDFTNVILIATSNAGTQFILDETQKGTDIATIQSILMNEKLSAYYRPEFLNRFDDVLVFKPLGMEDVVSIAYLMLGTVKKRLEEKGIGLEITDSAVHEIAQKGYDPKFGARPLRRIIQEEVDNKLADFLLTGQVGRRDVVVIDAGNAISVRKAQGLT